MIFRDTPIFPQKIDTRCEFYRDSLGRLFKKQHVSSMFVVFNTEDSYTWFQYPQANTKDFVIKNVQNGDCIGWDGNSVYGDNVISGVDIETWSELGRGYSRDAKHVYYTNKVLPDADPATFAIVSTYNCDFDNVYAKDKNIVWFNDKVVIDADASSFVAYCTQDLGEQYGFDNKGYYKNGVYITTENIM